MQSQHPLGKKKDIGWVEMCQIITSGPLLYSSWRRSCHFLVPNRLLLPWHFLLLPAQLCQDVYHAILQAGSLNNFPKERGIGGIISWDHLADPAVSLLSGGCISTAEGVTNCALQRNGWKGGGGIGSTATQKSTHSLPRGGQQACTLTHYLVLWPNL